MKNRHLLFLKAINAFLILCVASLLGCSLISDTPRVVFVEPQGFVKLSKDCKDASVILYLPNNVSKESTVDIPAGWSCTFVPEDSIDYNRVEERLKIKE